MHYQVNLGSLSENLLTIVELRTKLTPLRSESPDGPQRCVIWYEGEEYNVMKIDPDEKRDLRNLPQSEGAYSGEWPQHEYTLQKCS
jgi:hypothetical protein